MNYELFDLYNAQHEPKTEQDKAYRAWVNQHRKFEEELI